jgi:hypothetical protein
MERRNVPIPVMLWAINTARQRTYWTQFAFTR